MSSGLWLRSRLPQLGRWGEECAAHSSHRHCKFAPSPNFWQHNHSDLQAVHFHVPTQLADCPLHPGQEQKKRNKPILALHIHTIHTPHLPIATQLTPVWDFGFHIQISANVSVFSLSCPGPPHWVPDNATARIASHRTLQNFMETSCNWTLKSDEMAILQVRRPVWVV